MSERNVLDIIGNTPVVKLKSYAPSPGVEIWAKLEGHNPGGSIKDRIALYMLKNAPHVELVKGSKRILEATSGNTGIGLAMVSAVLGYKFTAVMPDNVSLERRKLLKAYGADLILTPGAKGTNYAIEAAGKLLEEDPEKYFMPDQFNNPANVLAHYETTGREILADLPGTTHFVAGMGTGGTLMGVGSRLKEHNPAIKIVGVEPRPDTAIQGLRNMDNYIPTIYRENRLDEKLVIKDEQAAFALARDLCKREGLSVGISSGAALWGAIETAKNIRSGVIVAIFPDRGDRYMSTELFTD